MRNLKFIRLLPLVLTIILITMISSSCVDDNEPISDYAGKWLTTKLVPGSSGYASVNYSLTITDHTFVETFLSDIYRATPTYPGTFVTIEGLVSTSGNIMSFTPQKMSFSNYNSATSTASEPYETFTNKAQNFDHLLDALVLPTSNHQGEYEIINSQLFIKADYNRDGIFSENEKSVYTKQ